MKLIDKLVLALKSAVGGAASSTASTVGDVVRETIPAAGKREDTLRLLEKAQARIDLLRADADRAGKRGDTALADRLKLEATQLQQTVDKTRKRIGAAPAARSNSRPSSASVRSARVSFRRSGV